VPGALLVGLLMALPLAGCGSAAPRAAAVTAVPAPTYSPPVCPSPAATPGGQTRGWPAGFPARFPRPAGLRVVAVSSEPGGIRLARFTSTLGLRASVLVALHALPAAGFRLGRGDAEANETDIPFSGTAVHGLLRLDGASPCSVVGILAVSSSTGGSGPRLAPQGQDATAPASP
jgi:hypothetical protein